MEGYLGETVIEKTKDWNYANHTKMDWAKLWIEKYGGYDGAHHKDWVLDQVARIIHDTEVIVSLAKWENGHKEYRFDLAEPPQKYWDWVAKLKDGEDGPDTYSYEFGIAP